jgi:hypothetical protein
MDRPSGHVLIDEIESMLKEIGYDDCVFSVKLKKFIIDRSHYLTDIWTEQIKDDESNPTKRKMVDSFLCLIDYEIEVERENFKNKINELDELEHEIDRFVEGVDEYKVKGKEKVAHESDNFSVAYIDVDEFSLNNIPKGWFVWSVDTCVGIHSTEKSKWGIRAVLDGPGDVAIIRALKGTPIPEGYTEIFHDTPFIEKGDIRFLMFKGPIEDNEMDSYKKAGVYDTFKRLGLISQE